MSELQNDAVAPVKNDAAPVENQATEAELATASGGEHEKISPVDEAAAKEAAKQQVINERIGKVTHQARQAERERDEAQAKIAKFEEEQRATEAARAGEIPPLPNEYDDDFEAKVAEHVAAKTRQATFEASQANYLQQQQNQQEEAQRQAQAQQQQQLNAYNVKAAEFGIDATELQAAENAVVSYGVGGELANHMLSDPEGPLIVKHLAANPTEAMALVNMSPYEQGAALAEIKVKASALKPKPTNTPNPPEALNGSGINSDTGNFPNSAGATFS